MRPSNLHTSSNTNSNHCRLLLQKAESTWRLSQKGITRNPEALKHQRVFVLAISKCMVKTTFCNFVAAYRSSSPGF